MIDTDTMVIILDDVRKDFDFESLLSAITSNLVIEKKGKDPITIPFSDAPKFIITTNYTIDGTGNSFDRRKHEIEFSNHYNKYNTPDQEFGHRLFEDWDEDEWTRFYSSVIYYIQQYLRNGLVKYEFKNLWQRKIINATSVDFFDFAENNIEPDREYTKSKLLKDFQEQYPEYDKLKSNTLTKWLKIYAENKNFTIIERKSNKNRYFTFAIAVEGQNEENYEQDPKIINPSEENSTDELFPFMKNLNDNNDSPMDEIF
jgi:hypothetical protein